MTKKDLGTFSLNCRFLKENLTNYIKTDRFSVEIKHVKDDPVNVNRVYLSDGDIVIEILPTKGFSIGKAFYKDRQIFWEPPFDMVDPDDLDLKGAEINMRGEYPKGVTYLKTFCGGIELLGLENWGMHYEADSGEVHPLHGEISNVPGETIEIEMNYKELKATGILIWRTYKGDKEKVWHKRGNGIFKVTRTIFLKKALPEIYIEDKIENISNDTQVPDFGYHLTLFPEKGAELFVPSKSYENREKNQPAPKNFDVWPPNEDASVRSETGIIRKGLRLTKKALKDSSGVISLVTYPDGRGISMTVPNVPYFQSWICSGGKGNPNWLDKNGESIQIRNWDGIGIEIGNSSLDHDGNVDPDCTIDYQLKPGEVHTVKLLVKILDKQEAGDLKDKIKEYNKGRVALTKQ